MSSRKQSKRTRIIPLDDGVTIAFKSGQSFWLTCCDCNLSHKIAPMLIDDEIQLTMTRDVRRTAQKRRRAKEKQISQIGEFRS